MKSCAVNTYIKKRCVLLLFCFCALQAFCKMSFVELDLSEKGTLLFSALSENAWHPSYKALFASSVDGKSVQFLSCFPEKMELLHEGKTLQVRNSFGTARFSSQDDSIRLTKQSSIFDLNASALQTSLANYELSPDGNWSLYTRKSDNLANSATQSTSAQNNFAQSSYELVLVNEVDGISTVVAKTDTLAKDFVPVRWAEDSSYFLYEKNGNVLFANPQMFFDKKRISDEYRILCKGTVRSVCWASSEELIYVSGRDVYSVRKNQLFTRALYANVVGTGTRIASLPLAFDEKTDSFWVNQDASSAIFVQNKQNLWVCDLTSEQTVASVAPFVKLPAHVTNINVFWTQDNLPIIWLESLVKGNTEAFVFGMQKNTEQNGRIQYGIASFAVPKQSYSPEMSPNGAKIAFLTPDGLRVYESATFTECASFTDEKVYSFLWANDEALFVGGYETISSWNTETLSKKLLFLSSVSQFGFSTNEQAVLALYKDVVLEYTNNDSVWRQSDERLERARRVQNKNVRVYIDSSKNDYFANNIYVRYIGDVIQTKPLFAKFNAPSTSTVEAEQNLTQRSERGKNCKAVSLVFNALDNADGVTDILSSLKKYNIKATFFINGEFLRRYPASVREIASSGHQCANLFFTSSDFLTVSSGGTDAQFIAEGLARTEDEFYALTGKDLSLIWHTPSYVANDAIKKAGANVGYEYLAEDIAPADWVTTEMDAVMPGMYKSSAELIAWTVQNLKDGGVISLSVGISGGTRKDYVYQQLDTLIEEIMLAGYEIVPYKDL